MGREALGTFIIATGTIPAGSDGAKLFPLFSAPGVAVSIEFIQYYGGDSGEFAQLHLVPPTTTLDGTTGPSDIPGIIACTPPEYMFGTLTQDKPGTFGADNGGRGTAFTQRFIVPPNYQIGITQDTANTAAWVVTVGGFVLEE
jgi:hypothetical protein